MQEHLERNTRHLEGTRIARSAAMKLGGGEKPAFWGEEHLMWT